MPWIKTVILPLFTKACVSNIHGDEKTLLDLSSLDSCVRAKTLLQRGTTQNRKGMRVVEEAGSHVTAHRLDHCGVDDWMMFNNNPVRRMG